MHESMKNAKTLGNMPRILPREKATPLEMPAQRLQAWLRPLFVHTDTPPTRKSGTDVPVHIIHAASCEHIPVCAHGEKNYINENSEIQLFCHRLLSSGPGVRVTLGAPNISMAYECIAYKPLFFPYTIPYTLFKNGKKQGEKRGQKLPLHLLKFN